MAGARARAWLLVGILAVIGGGNTARANPGTENYVLTHVQPIGDTLCGWMPFWYCTGLRQSTPLLGPLEFDLITNSPYAFCAPGGVALGVDWPADWVFLSADVCGPGPTSFEPAEHGGIVRLPDFGGLAWSQGGLGVAKIVLDVTSPGWFEVAGVSDCEWIVLPGARAGSNCGDCVVIDACTHQDLGRPAADPDTLELQAGAGSPASGLFEARNVRTNDNGSLSFVASENWMALDVQTIGDPGSTSYRVTVNTSPGLLGPAVYEGSVEVHAPSCYERVRVILTVTDDNPPAAIPETWGSVKSRFR